MIRDPSFENFQQLQHMNYLESDYNKEKMHHNFQRDKPRPSSAKDNYFEDQMDSRMRMNVPFHPINDRYQNNDIYLQESNVGKNVLMNPRDQFNKMESFQNPSVRRAHSYFNMDKQSMNEPYNIQESMLESLRQTPNKNDRFDPILGLPTLEYPSFLNETTPNIDNMTLHRECLRLNNELEISREKLNACMTSIKTFWSPELKRERTMRKEESSKYSIITDHLHQLQLEKQNLIQTIHSLENEITNLKNNKDPDSMDPGTKSENDLLKRRIEELTRENRRFIKDIEDADKKIANLNSTLSASEESLARLIEAVKTNNKNMSDGSDSLIRIDRLESDKMEIERLRNQLNEATQKCCEAERSMIDKDSDYRQVEEELSLLQEKMNLIRQDNESLRQHVRQTQTLQSLVDTKESKILTLENEIRILEDEICRLRDDGVITPTTSLSSGIDDFDKTLHNMKSNERLLKSKIEILNGELSKRESEIYACQSRLEMLEKQQQDQTHHVDVLKEQVKTREHKISMLTSDTDDLRKRLKEKDLMIEKKTKTILNIQNTKRVVDTEINELKEQMDIRDRKISLQKRKIENLEDLLNEKEAQLVNVKSRLNQAANEKPILDANAKAIYDDKEKEREQLLEKIKETKQRYEVELNDELNVHRKQISDLRERLESTQNELNEKVSQLQECRDELSELRITKFKQETELSQMKGLVSQKQSEVNAMNIEKQMLYKQAINESEMKFGQRINDLDQKVNHYMESASKLQQEVDRYINLVRSLEKEKNDRESRIHELEEQMANEESSVNSLKKMNIKEKKRLSQALEDAQQRLESIESELELNRSRISEKDHRVRELEQALRESVRLTAEHDMFANNRDESSRLMESQMKDLQVKYDLVQREKTSISEQLSSIREELKDREVQLNDLKNECLQGYIPELEKLRKNNFDLNMRIVALLKLMHGKDQLTEQDKIMLNNTSLVSYGGLFTANNAVGTNLNSSNWNLHQQNLAPAAPGLTINTMTRSTPIGYQTAFSGTTSPHLIGSAFQIIGTNQNPSSGTQLRSLSNNNDSSLFARIISEKERLIQQQVQDIAKLKFENAELDIKVKSLQREINKSTQPSSRTIKFDTGRYSSIGDAYDSGRMSSLELNHLKTTNNELSLRVDQLRRALHDREDRIRLLESIQNVDLSLELDKLRKELTAAQSESITRNSYHSKELERLKEMNMEMSNAQSTLHTQILEKEEKTRAVEIERAKVASEYEALHKKYQSVLTQLSAKSDKIQQLEKECYFNQMDEIKRLRLENEEAERRYNYLQKSYSEKEQRYNDTDRESMKLRDEVSKLRNSLHTTEAKLKTVREEISYRDERLRQIQLQNTEEVNRLRNCNQDQASKASHLKLTLDEKDHQLKMSRNEMEKCQSELDMVKKRLKECESQYIVQVKELEDKLEETKNIQVDHKQQKEELHKARMELDDGLKKISSLQKRIDERELRLRKIENDNHKLLDEIHSLRKTNQEYESEIDNMRQRAIEVIERPSSRSSVGSPKLYHSSFGSDKNYAEIERLRRQCSELITNNGKLQSDLNESQINLDRLNLEKESLRTEIKVLREALEKRHDMEVIEPTNNPNSSLYSELNEKDSQIKRITEQLDRLQATIKITQPTNQTSMDYQNNTLINELQMALHQANLEREQMRTQLTNYIANGDFSTPVNAHQALLGDQTTMQQHLFILQQTNVQLSKDVEIYKMEIGTLQKRIQELTKQVQDNQANFETVAKQRDQLNERVVQLNNSLIMKDPGVTARPASGMISSSSTGHLSRELDRVHREYEDAKAKIQELEAHNRTVKAEYDSAKLELKRLKEEFKKVTELQKDLQESAEAREEEISKLQKSNTDKYHSQIQEMANQMQQMQNEIARKDKQLEEFAQQSSHHQERCHNLEKEFIELQKLHQRSEMDDNERQRHHYETETLMKELEIRENEVNQLKAEVSQLNQVLDELRQIIQELSQKCDMLSADLERCNSNQENSQESISSSRDLEEARRQLALLKDELNDSNKARRESERQFDQSQQRLEMVNKELFEKTERIQILEIECFQQQAEEIDRLRKELDAVSSGSNLGQVNISNLKQEIDSLRKELNRRNDTISKMDMDCQEKHIKRLESAQLQIRRYEEEATNLGRVLDEQRKSLEERDKLIRQLRESGNNSVKNEEYERLMKEHSQCKTQLEQRSKQINTLVNQLESQTEEILTIKQEALTASLCEKDANIALMELTAPKNDSSSNVLEQMRSERSQIQTQLKQLSTARAAMIEEKKSRKS